MRVKKILIFMIYISLTTFVWSFDLSIANLYQYSPEGNTFTERDITKDLLQSLRVADKEGILSLYFIKSKDIPKSVLDTATLSEAENINFILYGFLKVTGNYFDFEVKFYDREAGGLQTIFYAKNTTTDYDELVQTMSARIIRYFNKTLGVTKRKREEEKEFGIIDIESGLGYWIPFDTWAETLMGLGTFHLSSSLTPVDPLFSWDIFSFALGYGLSLDYAPGMNREGYESFFMHIIRFGFPITFSTIWHFRNRILLQIAPELQFDILVQDRLHAETIVKKSAAFSLSGALGYEYIFTKKRFSLGGLVRFHTAFYTNIFFTIEPAFYCRYRWGD